MKNKQSEGVDDLNSVKWSKESYLKIRNQLLRQNGRLQSEIKRLESLRANGQLSECGLESLTRLKTTIETREDIIDRFDEPFGIPYH